MCQMWSQWLFDELMDHHAWAHLLTIVNYWIRANMAFAIFRKRVRGELQCPIHNCVEQTTTEFCRNLIINRMFSEWNFCLLFALKMYLHISFVAHLLFANNKQSLHFAIISWKILSVFECQQLVLNAGWRSTADSRVNAQNKQVAFRMQLNFRCKHWKGFRNQNLVHSLTIAEVDAMNGANEVKTRVEK